ncbi:MAG: helix-turn-helix domain-containing protein [Acidobacteria bacterium]|nr:helix-turn-helix domain-containing protein [Acidobacteriota bacterium]
MSEIITLSRKERSALECLLKNCATIRQYQRLQALLLLEEESVESVAAWFHVSRQSIYNWVSRFNQRQELPLLERVADAGRTGRPATSKGIIDPLIDAVIDSDPRDLDYNSTVWTATLLQVYLCEHHGHEVSLRSIGYAIERLQLRWKRPRHSLALRRATWRQAKGG